MLYLEVEWTEVDRLTSETAHTASGIMNDYILFEKPYVSTQRVDCNSRLLMLVARLSRIPLCTVVDSALPFALSISPDMDKLVRLTSIWESS